MKFFYPSLILVAILAISLSIIPIFGTPYLAFRTHVRELHMKDSDPHVEASYASIRESMLSAICLIPAFTIMPAICPTSTDVRYSLDDLALAQRVLYGEISAHTPAPNASAIFVAIAEAADLALVFDDMILLAEDGWLGVRGIGDASLLVEVGKASRAAAMGIYRLLVHMELSLARILSVQRIVAAQLDMLVHADARLCRLQGLSIAALNRVVLVSLEATSDSVRRLSSELQRTTSIVLKLLELLDTSAQRGGVQLQCAKLRRVDLCSRLDPLVKAIPVLEPIVSQLFALKDVLQEGVDGHALAHGGGRVVRTVYAIRYVDMVVRTHLDLLEGRLKEVSTTRQSVEATLA